ncbi:MAG: penicillin-binding protein 2 [Bdellovibrionales bacterium]|nr:penicillin-binding protein 2 [Bdellovibrionales bacterium]
MSANTKHWTSRYKDFFIYLKIGLLLLTARLFYLQIIKGVDFKSFSDSNYIKIQNIAPTRGLILDRNNKLLVKNLSTYQVTLRPSNNSLESLKKLGLVIGISTKEIKKIIVSYKKNISRYQDIPIKSHLNLTEINIIQNLALSYPNIVLSQHTYRYSLMKDNASQLFGLVRKNSNKKKLSNDHVGESGLEKIWDSVLFGKNGYNILEVDSKGRESDSKFSSFKLKSEAATPGNNIVLTLDKEIQDVAFKSFNRKDSIGPRTGALIAMKTNGEIIAWVSSPSYNNNLFSKKIEFDLWNKLSKHPGKPLINKVLQNYYSPGSTFKPIVALAALEKEVITEDSLLNTPSYLKYGNRFFHNHSKINHGNINLETALEISNNVFFYQLGIDLGIDIMSYYAKKLGLGLKTNIALPYEKKGLIPDKKWKKKYTNKKWQKGENLVHAIGQGYTLATPLQMLISYNTIATNGIVVKPLLVKSIINNEGKILKKFKTEIKNNLLEEGFKKKNFEIIKKGLFKVTNGKRGTAHWWKLKNYKFSGKTGTVQIRSFSKKNIYTNCPKLPLKDRHHGWFIGFAPADNPVITVAVLTEHSCHGSTGSTPLARDVMQAYLNKYPPEKNNLKIFDSYKNKKGL